MKIHNLFLILIMALIVASCSDDKIPNDPEGTVSLNMLNWDNGATTIGKTDVYIDEANNFTSQRENYRISSFANRSGLGSMKDKVVVGDAYSVAVENGIVYQIHNRGNIKEFPSGSRAAVVGSEYYNVYVVSDINKDEEVVGSNIKYIMKNVPQKELPDFDAKYGIGIYGITEFPIEIELPTADFEYITELSGRNEYEIVKEGNKIVIKMDGTYYDRELIGFFIRIKDIFTYVYADIRL